MDLEFNKNEDNYKQLIAHLDHQLAKVYKGGGPSKIAHQHKKGKLTARERIAYLLDKKKNAIYKY